MILSSTWIIPLRKAVLVCLSDVGPDLVGFLLTGCLVWCHYPNPAKCLFI